MAHKQGLFPPLSPVKVRNKTVASRSHSRSPNTRAPRVRGERSTAKLQFNQDVNWYHIAEKIPWGDDPTSKARRDQLWNKMDINGNGLASLAEFDKLVVQDPAFGFVVPKQVLMRAFQASKNLSSKSRRGSSNPDFVEKEELRMLLLYMRQYLELWVMFDALDDSQDHRIDEVEFKKNQNLLLGWGLKMKDVMRCFREVDVNRGGVILFDEFAHWAISKKLDLADDDDAEAAGAGSGLISSSFQSTWKPSRQHQQRQGGATRSRKINWTDIAHKIPWRNDSSSKSRRKRLWQKVDRNRNGYASLAEIDSVVVKLLGLGDVFAKPVLIRSYKASCRLHKKASGKSDGFVDRKEFKSLLVYMRQYLELWIMFDDIDASHDHRLSEDEFSRASDRLINWKLDPALLSDAFIQIDANHGGMVLFDELAPWAIKNKLDLEKDDADGEYGMGSGLITKQEARYRHR